MLSKSLRLSPHEKPVQPKTFESPHIRVKIWKNQESQSKFGFVVTKRIDKRATKRNRYRRLMQEAIAKGKETIPQGYNFLFFLRIAPATPTLELFEQEIEALVKKVSDW